MDFKVVLCVHSAKLPEGNHNATPSITLGCGDLAKERFMKNVDFVDDLKVTASSYAKLHQDLDI